MPVTIVRTPWVDDDGTGTTGTVLNNAVKTDLYNQIDGALAKVPQLNPPAPNTGNLTISGDFTEKNRPTPMGHWTDFTPTLTVDVGSVSMDSNLATHYTLIGKTCIVGIYWAITFSGAPTLITLPLPAGIVAGAYSGTAMVAGAAGDILALLVASAGAPSLTIRRNSYQSVAFATGPHVMLATLTFQIN